MLLMQQYQNYPQLQAEDIFKYLFQSSFGCEHLATSYETALRYIQNEYAAMSETASACTEQLDGAYSRIHLGVLRKGLRPETLAMLFCLSAQTEPDGKARLMQKLEIAQELILNSKLPLDMHDFAPKLEAWRAQGFPAVHHSDAFRAAYHPAYRVIANKYADFLPVFTAIDNLLGNGSVIVAIEGGSASGKSTLADILQQVYACNVFHTDDYFLRPEQRTPQRFAEIGGNLDRERFANEVLRSVCMEETVYYQRFDCTTQTLGEPITVPHTALTVIEGAYSMHPAFGQYYHLSIFLDIDPTYQKKRITARNSPQMARRFFDEWIPMENAYFSQLLDKSCVDMRMIVKDSVIPT